MEQLRSPSEAEGSQLMWSWPSAGFKQRAPLPLAGNGCEHPASRTGPYAQQGPTFCSMRCYHPEILNHFEQGDLHFHFALGLSN